jgi:ubiquinone/menaquinone biosynthesis C-methylase UbiE
MRRIKDEFLDILDSTVSLSGKEVLEIGCGDGSRSEMIANRCSKLVGIEPDGSKVALALQRATPNASFQEGVAESIPFESESFDLVLFTLSLHHVPMPDMGKAIDEAVRVVRPTGFIVFFEPDMIGSFFEGEIKFDACDGDEREAKKAAYQAMMKHKRLILVNELPDETVFEFDSLDDFMSSMTPKKNLGEVEAFLRQHDYALNAQRRINIFRPC